MICFYLLWTLCYFALMTWFAGKWPKRQKMPEFSRRLPAVSLLIPLRNELENLETLLAELERISYPELEILLIDDQSEDGTFSVLEEKTAGDSRIKLLKSPDAGKKAAIQFGVEAARADFILCTDADCCFPEFWVESTIVPFLDPKIQLVAGPVISFGNTSFFQRFQQIEWASILLTTQFFFSQRRPLMCSAANFAYRKSAFQEVKGYDQNRQLLSGDDEFLLKKILARFGEESCVYLPHTENLVYTKPQGTFSDLVNQRVRWAGKWKLHRDLGHAFAAVASFSVQLIWLMSVVLIGVGTFGVLVICLVWVVKTLAEKLALGRVLKALDLKLSLVDFIKTSLLHPFYLLTVAVGAIRGKFEWKGRAN